MSLFLENQAIITINNHGEAYFPNECCGFLYGRTEGEKRIITLAKPVTNIKDGDQKRRFEISPLDYMKAERFALENDTELLGIYHSHPNHPAIASVHDLEKALPFFSYVIISVMDGTSVDVKSWRLKDEERAFFEEKVEVESTSKKAARDLISMVYSDN